MVDPKAVEDFANRIELFLTDMGVRKTFRWWEQKEVKQYDYPKVVEQYEAAYKEAIVLRNHHKLKGAEQSEGRIKKFKNRLLVRRHAG